MRAAEKEEDHARTVAQTTEHNLVAMMTAYIKLAPRLR
jgi:hypothetical protein